MKKICIVYASLSGNTEDIANLIKANLEKNYLVDLKPAEYTLFNDVSSYDGIIIGTYTWNDGIIPFEFNQFFTSIDERIKDKYIGIYGSGDMKYKFYCTAVDSFYNKVKSFGTKISENKLKMELGPDNEEKIKLIKIFTEEFENLIENKSSGLYINCNDETLEEKFRIFSQLSKEHEKLGISSDSDYFFNKAKEILAFVKDYKMKDRLYAHLSNERISPITYDESLDLFNNITDIPTKIKTAHKLIRKLKKIKNIEKAKELIVLTESLIEKLEENADKIELISAMGASYKDIDEAKGILYVNKAFDLSEKISSAYERAIALNEIGAHYFDLKYPEKGFLAFEKSVELSENISEPLKKADSLIMTGGEMAEKHQKVEAKAILEKAQSILNTLPDSKEKMKLLTELSKNLGQSFDIDSALELANTMNNPYEKGEALIKIIKNLKKMHKEQEAYKLLKSVFDLAKDIDLNYEKAILYRKIATEYINFDKKTEAKLALNKAYLLVV